MHRLTVFPLGGFLFAAALSLALACEEKVAEEVQAPETPSLEEPEAPATEDARSFAVTTEGSDVTFLMEAPVENIRGRAPDAVTGVLTFDLMDLTKSTGLIKIDLLALTLYQTKRESADAPWGDETKSDLQNEHMRNWFQISPEAPEEMREANRVIEFRMNKIEGPSNADITAMTGAERTVTAIARGDFRLHGRTVTKSAPVELTFRYEGGTPTSVRVRSTGPVNVSLEEHEVQPRETFAQLATKTLAALGSKVADTAPVEFAFEATVSESGDAE